MQRRYPSPAAPFVSTGRCLSRRHFLRGAGAALALPLLDAMTPAFARSDSSEPKPRRMLAVCNNLGLLPNKFFPTGTGRGYTLSPYLEILSDYRDDFTVFSGVSHPGVDGSHASEVCFLTAAPHPASGGFQNTISLDQAMADHIGHLTRFPSFSLGVNTSGRQRGLSWTGGGVLIPCEESAAELYKQLFVQGTPDEVKRQIHRLTLGQSIMDAVAEEAADFKRRLGKTDRARLEQYSEGVRDLEKRLLMSREWEQRPKPKATTPAPLDPENPAAYMAKVRLMYDMARLAFETDSTRLITLFLDSANSPAIDVEGIRITDGYHNLSHHGKNESKLKQLEVIDA